MFKVCVLNVGHFFSVLNGGLSILCQPLAAIRETMACRLFFGTRLFRYTYIVLPCIADQYGLSIRGTLGDIRL